MLPKIILNYSGQSEELSTIFRLACPFMRDPREKGVSARHSPFKGKICFLLYSVWWPRWDLLGCPTFSGAFWCDPGKSGRRWQRVKILTKVTFSRSLSVVLGQERKVKFPAVPSFPNSDWQEKTFLRIRSLNRDWWICFWAPIGDQSFLF